MSVIEPTDIPVGFGVYTSDTQYKYLNGFSYLMLFLSIIFVVLVVVYMFIHIFNKPQGSVPYEDIGPDLVDGAHVIPYNGSAYQTEALCVAQSDRTVWTNTGCQCKPALYGPECLWERYPPEVFCVANSSFDFDFNYTTVNGDNLYYTVEGVYDPESCLAKCDKDETCSGIIYDTDTCKHIIGNIEIKPERFPIYDIKEKCTMYAYSNNQIKSNYQVYAYIGDRPLRYYTGGPYPNFKVIIKGVVEEVSFTPNKMTNQSQSIGVWCSSNFDPSEYNAKLNDPNCFVDEGHTHDEYEFNVPLTEKPYYVMYN